MLCAVESGYRHDAVQDSLSSQVAPDDHIMTSRFRVLACFISFSLFLLFDVYSKCTWSAGLVVHLSDTSSPIHSSTAFLQLYISLFFHAVLVAVTTQRWCSSRSRSFNPRDIASATTSCYDHVELEQLLFVSRPGTDQAASVCTTK
jgi:hypothetical protein